MAERTLQKAKINKADEFYTQLADIEAEMRHYREQFRGKVIFCNCDDPFESNFFKYFAMNFNFLGLRKLIATCYTGSAVAGEQLSLFDVPALAQQSAEAKPPHKIEITEVTDENQDGAVDLADVEYLLRNRKNALTLLEGDGDFRSAECIRLLREADIVVTNPPFSLFREYIAQLIEYKKEFIIIGSKNAITYKDVFKLIKENKLWLGNGFPNGNAFFKIPVEYARDWASGVYDPETGLVKFRNVGWFTNLDFQQRHENITLYEQYTPEKYPRYDNYDAIEVSKTAEIPYDYDGNMGVPITFLDRYNPEQFEILGMCENLDLYGLKTRVYTGQECKDRYFELFGKKRNAVIDTIRQDFPLNVMYWVDNGDGTFEVLDGQQRTISFCQYVKGDFSLNNRAFHNLTETEKEQILNYPLMVYFCEGNDKEKLDWFKIINIAGEKLTDQELRNAVYTGPWLSDAKLRFSKTGCAAYGLAKDYVSGSPIRQEMLETAVKWIGKGNIEGYMSAHQHDPNANELWMYFRNVIEWVKLTFTIYRKEMKGIEWGGLYDEFKGKLFDTAKLEREIQMLMMDDDVTRKKGVYPYVLTREERHLSIRAFTDGQKRAAYERQKGICVKCGKHFEFNGMAGDHITPWSKGGKTTAENCQMLCLDDNRRKSDV